MKAYDTSYLLENRKRINILYKWVNISPLYNPLLNIEYDFMLNQKKGVNNEKYLDSER